MVWIYFDILEIDVLFEEDEEYALDEGAELDYLALPSNNTHRRITRNQVYTQPE